VLLDVDDVAMGHTSLMRWNPPSQWIVSTDPAHPAIIDPVTFDAAQQRLHRRGRQRGGEPRSRRTRTPYVFGGMLHCAYCQRRMQGQQSNGEPYYRCRYPQEYALANPVDHPLNVYLRERDLIAPLDLALARAFAPHRLHDTISALEHPGRRARHPATRAGGRGSSQARRL
jgi:site-specific DNA recombinase